MAFGVDKAIEAVKDMPEDWRRNLDAFLADRPPIDGLLRGKKIEVTIGGAFGEHTITIQARSVG